MQDPYTPETLSKILIKQIGSIVDNNQAKESDVISTSLASEVFTAKLYIEWTFTSGYEEEKIAGGKTSSIDFGQNTNNFTSHYQQLHNIAIRDQQLRAPFLQNLIALERAGINHASAPIQYHHFEPFSVKETCSSCKGEGNVNCQNCSGSGRVRCSACGGSGSRSEQVPIYRDGKYAGTRTEYRTCGFCSGGKVTCRSCSGRGRIRCDECAGHGYFTLTRRVYAAAIPSYQITTNAQLATSHLDHLLNHIGVEFCAEKIPFELLNHHVVSEEKYLFLYEGDCINLKQEFSLKNKQYTCYAFSNPPYPFVKPTIFDDLFADELELLIHAQSNGKVNKRKALSFFSKYTGQPVLDNAMRGIAENRQSTLENTAKIVENAAYGFISPIMAENLAKNINIVMDKVSPTYSKTCWHVASFLIAVCILIFIEDKFEKSILDSPVSTILSSLISVALLLLFSGFITYIVSSAVTLYIRRKIPKIYRQKLRNKEGFQTLLKVGGISLVIAALYGSLAAKAWLPAWNGYPVYFIAEKSQAVCQIDRLKNICGTKAKIVSPMLSEQEKILFIQRTLTANGYQLTVDGKFGKKTLAQSVTYLKSRGVTINKDKPTLDDIYQKFTAIE